MQLNDFCVICLESVSNQISKLESDYEKIESGELRINHEEIGDISLDVATGLYDYVIPTWQHTQEFLVRAMCLLLLSAYAEKSLRSLCDDLAPDNAKELYILYQEERQNRDNFILNANKSIDKLNRILTSYEADMRNILESTEEKKIEVSK